MALRLRRSEARSRGPLATAEREAQALETEARTLANLLGAGAARDFPPVVDAIAVARGYEAALGAALGDDLEAPVDEAAPAHWSRVPPDPADPQLPAAQRLEWLRRDGGEYVPQPYE